ncbi:MAG: ParB N-terminal domain-containing protein, partial [Acidimicrobiales bacterium]|nr:ParB N-terminal domain-containing protein [Acidimicrobiales bacterium]
DDVDDLARKVDDGREPPPVVVSHRADELHLEDGNHRVEAVRRAGGDHVWAVVAFDDAEARDGFVERTRLDG